jgi:hypothetical protein
MSGSNRYRTEKRPDNGLLLVNLVLEKHNNINNILSQPREWLMERRLLTLSIMANILLHIWIICKDIRVPCPVVSSSPASERFFLSGPGQFTLPCLHPTCHTILIETRGVGWYRMNALILWLKEREPGDLRQPERAYKDGGVCLSV